MRDFFKSRFFIISVIIGMILVIVPSVLSIMGLGDAIRGGVNFLLTPIASAFTKISDSLGGYAEYITEFDRLKEENAQLKSEIAEMRERIYKAAELEDMNEWLYEYLELKRQHTDFQFLDADIVSREAGNYMSVFTLNRGSAHGVEVNMPIVVPEGVVGYVTEVGYGWSKAVSLIETASAIGAYIERTGQLGLIEGNFNLMEKGLCELKYLPVDADINEGDRIISSGLGSVYPRGLVIGYVEEVIPNKYSQSMSATIRPAAELNETDRVMIVTDYEEYIQ